MPNAIYPLSGDDISFFLRSCPDAEHLFMIDGRPFQNTYKDGKSGDKFYNHEIVKTVKDFHGNILDGIGYMGQGYDITNPIAFTLYKLDLQHDLKEIGTANLIYERLLDMNCTIEEMDSHNEKAHTIRILDRNKKTKYVHFIQADLQTPYDELVEHHEGLQWFLNKLQETGPIDTALAKAIPNHTVADRDKKKYTARDITLLTLIAKVSSEKTSFILDRDAATITFGMEDLLTLNETTGNFGYRTGSYEGTVDKTTLEEQFERIKAKNRALHTTEPKAKKKEAEQPFTELSPEQKFHRLSQLGIITKDATTLTFNIGGESFPPILSSLKDEDTKRVLGEIIKYAQITNIDISLSSPTGTLFYQRYPSLILETMGPNINRFRVQTDGNKLSHTSMFAKDLASSLHTHGTNLSHIDIQANSQGALAIAKTLESLSTTGKLTTFKLTPIQENSWKEDLKPAINQSLLLSQKNIQHQNLKQTLKDKYLEPIAHACQKKFSIDKNNEADFKNYLINVTKNGPQPITTKQVDHAVKSSDLSNYTTILQPLTFADLASLDSGAGLGVIDDKDIQELTKHTKQFFKVTFNDDLEPTVTALNDDEIWGKNGLDPTQEFVVTNPGNGPTNLLTLATTPESEITKHIISSAKIFEKALKQYSPKKHTLQYLVTINEKDGQKNMDLIKQHNQNPDGFTTPYLAKQARLIYGPLITDSNGNPLEDQKIIKNLAKARSYNCSFGTVAANCHTNALVAMMHNLGISPDTTTKAIESMRRLDSPNMAATSPGISQSTVIFEGENDTTMLKHSIGGHNPPLPEDHTNLSIVEIDDHRVKLYQTLPREVYHPAKKPTLEEKAQEDAIVKNLPPLPKKASQSILQYLELDGMRYQDPNTHNGPHFTMPATPGNEVEGRDPDLLYKLIADMMNRENAKNVTHYFQDQNTAKEEKTWQNKFPSQKSAEVEDIIKKPQSWKQILKGKTVQDDSTIIPSLK